MNRLAITRLQQKQKEYISYILLNEKREFVDFQLFKDNLSILNNIYIGRVDNIVSNIQAAFVSISESQKCYLPLEDCKNVFYVKRQSQKNILSIGDLILVQISKEAVKTKDPVATTNLSLHGKYAVLTTGNTSLGVSKKISGDKQKELQDLLNSMEDEIDSSAYGIVLRTDASLTGNDVIKKDIRNLIDQYEYLTTIQIHRSMHSCVYESMPEYIQRIKASAWEDIDFLYTDCNDIFETLKNYLPEAYHSKICFYNDEAISLKTLYHIEGNLESLLNNRVWLKSGANLIIEQLETITFIDVNTAKNISKNEKVILNVNKEAATEIARQLRLRNISGMIIVDFINMPDIKMREELISHLKIELSRDVTVCRFLDFTKLGLAEITRKKTYASLKEIVK